ncbi:hypothetical protein RUND412_003114 [Rhizina undulata]
MASLCSRSAWSASFSNLLSAKSAQAEKDKEALRRDTFTSISDAHIAGPSGDSPNPPPASRSTRSVSSRPRSIIQHSQPPLIDVAQDTLPELQPIFTYLYDHSKKLYVEGYFLKLTDLNPDGKPSPDRSWVECFAQLVGTVLSLWDAAELDAGQDKEVVPTFLNLTDASIKMIESLPTRSSDVPPLTNVLSISTAGRNRYLFHFNSHHSLTQWTAGIRLSMFEHASLQEAYTGALIAGKGKQLNNINTIIEKTRFKHEDWARVRFGAGTPWRRCWAVISPPSEKTVKKQRTAMKKAQKSAYQVFPVLKGEIKFYDTKKSKKTQPIATITDAFSAYAIYPQSKPLIDQSTLVKIEGRITIHTDPPSSSEGFVFFMPEAHPAVSGFEIMLRWLFPTFDVFALYGRPSRLVADPTDVRSLMFAMPQDRDISYLELQDVTNLIVAEGTNINGESEWRRKLKELTAAKIKSGARKARTSLPAAQRFPGVTFEDGVSSRSSSSLPIPISQLPPQHVPLGTPPLSSSHYHQRSTSEATGYLKYQRQQRPPMSLDITPEASQGAFDVAPSTGKSDDSSSDDGLFQGRIDPAARRLQQQAYPPSPDSVPMTPVMTHPPSSKPQHYPQGRQLQHQISSNSLNFAGGLGASFRNGLDRKPSPPYSSEMDPRRSTESNLFEGVVPTRNERMNNVPPSFTSSISSPRAGIQGYNPVYPSQQSQITAQSSLPYQSPIEPPPGFALQSSQVLLAGPPPTNDEKIAYEEGYANRPPPAPVNAYQSPNALSLTAPVLSHKRFSWQESEAPTPILPHQSPDSPRKISDIPRKNGLDPSPSPAAPAKVPHRSPTDPIVPSLQTNIARKPVPTQLQTSGTPGGDSPDTTGSIGSFAAHLISEDALDKIGTRRNDTTTSNSQLDEDTLDRRAAQRISRMLNDSGSEYDDESDEPDYASIDTTREVVPVRDTTQPRAGKMKVVGNAPEPEVVVGDAHYRPNTAKLDLQIPEIPKVDFGVTMNHGRSLSADHKADHKGVNRGNAQVVEQEHYPSSQHGTLIGGDPRRQSQQGLGVDMWTTQQRAASRSSIGSEDKRRESWNRISPEYGHERGGSQSSDSDQSKRRSMQWQPGMAQIGSMSPDRREGAEQYVSDKAYAAQQQSRSRYAHQRKHSGQLLTTGQRYIASPQPHSARSVSADNLFRPSSRGGNAAFIPNGLVSAAADLTTHLSAREQEYVAKQTGSTLLHLEDTKSNPPHQAGLLGAIEHRELEKKQMKSSITVQQAIAQRQQLQQQQQHQKGRTTPSPRPLAGTPTTGYGQGPNYDAGSYLPSQQPPPQGYYAPQQQQQPGSQYYYPQGQGFGQYYQGGQQYSRN